MCPSNHRVEGASMRYKEYQSSMSTTPATFTSKRSYSLSRGKTAKLSTHRLYHDENAAYSNIDTISTRRIELNRNFLTMN